MALFILLKLRYELIVEVVCLSNRGRPRKNSGGYKIVTIRMTADEYEEYQELVRLNGGTSSDFLRRGIGILKKVLKKDHT